jgi:hypothetical protein
MRCDAFGGSSSTGRSECIACCAIRYRRRLAKRGDCPSLERSRTTPRRTLASTTARPVKRVPVVMSARAVQFSAIERIRSDSCSRSGAGANVPSRCRGGIRRRALRGVTHADSLARRLITDDLTNARHTTFAASCVDVRRAGASALDRPRVRQGGLLGADRANIERAVIERHHERQVNPGPAQWRLMTGPWTILYNHPDGDDWTTARIVTLWRRR